MTAAEFSLWAEEYRRSPWGEERDGLHAALVAQTVANFAGKMINGPPAKLSEFLLDFESDQKPLSPQQQAQVVAEEEPDPIAHFKQFMR